MVSGLSDKRGAGWKRYALRPLIVPATVLVLGCILSIGLFLVESAAVRHTDRLLLRQDAVQGSLVLNSFVGQTPPEVVQLARQLSPVVTSASGWTAVAGPVAKADKYSGLALLRQTDSRLVVVASVGTIQGRFGTSADEPVIASLMTGHSPYAGVVQGPGGRWLTQLVSAPSMPGYVVYSEQPISNRPVSLASLPGHPFSGIAGAIYVGHEVPQDLVFSSTSHLPLTGERATTVISGSNPFASNPARLSNRIGSLSDPGGFILVIRATGNLSGTTSALLPWILLLIGLVLAAVVAASLWVSRRHRARMTAMVDELEARNVDLDGSMRLQKSTAARFSAMVRSSSDLTTIISSDGQIRYQSPSSSALLGLSPDLVLGTDFTALVHSGDHQLWRGALAQSEMLPGTEVSEGLRLIASDGSCLSVETRITNLLDDPAVSGIVLNSRDVSEHKRLESELRHQAFHDSLTGLANRALFEDRLENALNRLIRTRGTLGVLFLDLDDFKAVNDGRGHKVGDELLRAVSERLRAIVRAGDTLARIGGDEFAVLVEGTDPAGALETAERILEILGLPVQIGKGQTCVRVSIGVVTTTSGQHGAQELLRDADVAMYAAKNAGKGRIEVFHSGLHEEVIRRLQLEVDLGRALDHGELSVHYQPLVEIASGEIVGVEALMRWEHPQRGTVMPEEFIPVAESTGLIGGMGKWMLQRACRDLGVLQEATGRIDLHLAVNLSIKQLEDLRIVDQVGAALAGSGLPSNLLTLEITESVFMTNGSDSRHALEQLKALGVRLSIDDFGTGFSSLGRLHRLPVDELKIDRSFVAAIEDHDADAASLVHTIIRLARDFGLGTVAEGIETQRQLRFVREAGCQVAQGYLFAKPVELSQLLSIISDNRKLSQLVQPCRLAASI